jgi:hypothetical protein
MEIIILLGNKRSRKMKIIGKRFFKKKAKLTCPTFFRKAQLKKKIHIQIVENFGEHCILGYP